MKDILPYFFLCLLISGCKVHYELSPSKMGIYNIADVNRTTNEETATGYRSNVSGAELSQETHIIYLDDVVDKQFIGFDYCINKFHKNKLKDLDVIKFDVTIRTPPIVKPNGEVITTEAVNLVGITSAVTYYGYIFSEDWERVPGIWSFEFSVKGEKIGVINFDVREGSASDEALCYGVFDTAPMFNGGEKELSIYLDDNLEYPMGALEQVAQGEVIIGFVVNKNGLLSQFSIVKSANYYLDQAALELVKAMPKWIPATQNGNNVNAIYSLPIVFRYVM